MKPRNNVDSADAVLTLRNTIWAFPYLAVMGLIWGYLADESSGAIVGLAAAEAISVLIGSATTIFDRTLHCRRHYLLVSTGVDRHDRQKCSHGIFNR